MILLPAIDLYNGCAVRLTKGDYAQMTVYSEKPWEVAHSFEEAGAIWLHVVDLEGARDGTTANFATVERIVNETGMSVELGGGIRSREVVERYIGIGVERVILGTAAITLPGFVDDMVALFGDKIAVGVDLKDGMVAIKGWTEVTAQGGVDFCRQMEAKGVKTIICTDISKDGVMGGTNTALYRSLLDTLTLNIIASGGVSSLKDIMYLNYLGVYGAILGKALYEGKLNLKEAIDGTTEGCCGG